MVSKLLSIIIPVYNAESFLNDCLNSVVSQCPEEIEVILVNDGSTDSSKHIIEKYCSIYPYIKFIDQTNKGVSVARNVALKNANGEYIVFLDADDMLSDKFFKCIVPQLNKCDILEINAICLINSNVTSQPIMNYRQSGAQINLQMKKQRLHQQYRYYPFLRIVKKTILKNIKFNEKITFCEDALFITECYAKATSIRTIDKAVYYYRQHETNATHTNQIKNIQSLTDLLTITINYIGEVRFSEKLDFVALFLNMLHRRKSMLVVNKRRFSNDATTKMYINLCKEKNYINKSRTHINKIVKFSINYPYLSNILILFKSLR